MSKEILEGYKSTIKLDDFANKLYVDPQYGFYQPKATVNYSVLRGKWDIEDVPEENIIRLVLRDSGDSISLSFNSLKDKIDFVKGIYAEHPVKQVGKGMDLEKLANNNLFPRMENYFNNMFKKLIPTLENIKFNLF